MMVRSEAAPDTGVRRKATNRSGKIRLAVGVITMGGLAAVTIPAEVAHASVTISVPCSGATGGAPGLSSAIRRANGSGGGTITLAPGCTYVLTAPDASDTNTGLPHIKSSITINGPAAIVRSSSSAFRILLVDPNGSLTVNGLTISQGQATGGGIYNNGGSLTVNTSRLSGNVGGAIDNHGGRVTLNASHLDGNLGPFSPGLTNESGVAMLNHSTVSNNGGAVTGGGILNGSGATMTLNSTVVSGNWAFFEGGGILNTSRAALTLISSTVTGNRVGFGTAGGAGIYNQKLGAVLLILSKVTGNMPDNCAPAASVPGC